MKKLFISLGLMFLLAACATPTQAPQVEQGAEETPLLTDADFDKATLQVAETGAELTGIELGEAFSERKMLPPLPEVNSELSAQAVLPGVSGDVYYIGQDNRPTILSVPYSIYRHNQATDARVLVYSGNRAVQSVSGTGDGKLLVVSMKETSSASSDYELYLIVLTGFREFFIYQITNDTVDNINVSISLDGSRIVNQEEIEVDNFLIPSIIVRNQFAYLNYSKDILISPRDRRLPHRHPSLSGNGNQVAFVREFNDGTNQVVNYEFSIKTFTDITPRTSTILDYPSVSDNGIKVMWLQRGTTDQVVLQSNLFGTTQSVATGSITRAHLTADGNFMSYQSGRNIVTKNLRNGQVQTIATGLVRAVSFYAPMWQKLGGAETKVSGNVPNGTFGRSIAVSDDLIVVGAPHEMQDTGAVYLYQRTLDGSYLQIKKLIASDNELRDRFGYSVAISGNTIVVGARGKPAVYVFQKDQGGLNNWGEVKKITSTNGAARSFGYDVAISGDTLVVGAYLGAYVFQKDQGGTDNWGEVKQVVTTNWWVNVAISGNTAVLGDISSSPATDCDPRTGSVYILEKDQGGLNNWGEVKRLSPECLLGGDGYFGASVAISGSTLVVGESLRESAYVFEKDQGGLNNWGEVKKFQASDVDAYLFGHSVAISGNVIVVGTPGKPQDTNSDGTNEENVGAAYIFERNRGGANNWGEAKKLVAANGLAHARYGLDVAVSGGTFVVGAPEFDLPSPAMRPGSIYIYNYE